jgi:Spy/CpxP family protein refolding chaperone
MNNVPNGDVPRTARRRLFTRATLVAFLAGGALAAGVTAIAQDGGMAAWHRGMMSGAAHSPAEVSAHVDHVLKHLYVEIDATDAQKAQIGPLVHQAVTDLVPLLAQARAAHAQALDTLTQPTIDRSALEAARAAHLQLADQASKRFTQLIADVGDVLTPAQRTQFAAHLRKLHGMDGT